MSGTRERSSNQPAQVYPKYSRWKLSEWLVYDLGGGNWLLLQDSLLCRQVYRKVSKQENMQASKLFIMQVSGH